MAQKVKTTPSWCSGQLPFSRAAHVWAAAAGVSGAYVPAEFARLAGIFSPPTGGGAGRYTAGDPDPSPLCLPLLLEEAVLRAEWRAKYEEAVIVGLPFGRPDGSFVLPRSAEVLQDRLVWETSVIVALAPHPDGGWEVAIEGDHNARIRAAKDAMRSSGQ